MKNTEQFSKIMSCRSASSLSSGSGGGVEQRGRRQRSRRRKTASILSPLLFALPLMLLQPCSCRYVSNTTCDTRDPNRCEKVIMKRGDEVWRVENEGRRLAETSYKIKVFIWVLKHSDGTGSFSKANAQTAIAYLNDAFASTNFQFELHRRKTKKVDKYHYCSGDFVEEYRKGGGTRLNLFICDAYNNLGVLGYASFPHEVEENLKDDGVVLMNPNLYDTPNEVYMTLVHEVGHWLGLLHTFSDGCEEDADNDGGSGDGVTDTAAHAGASWWSSGWKECFQTENTDLNTCSDTDSSIDAGYDPVQNYMNYIHEDCMMTYGEFTTGQVERMLSQWETYRNADTRRRYRRLGRLYGGLAGFERFVAAKNMTRDQRHRYLSSRPGIQSTNDTHVYNVCLETTMDECGCDSDCIQFLKRGVKIIT